MRFCAKPEADDGAVLVRDTDHIEETRADIGGGLFCNCCYGQTGFHNMNVHDLQLEGPRLTSSIDNKVYEQGLSGLQVTLERRPDERLGLELDLVGGRTPQIYGMSPGVASAYNRSAPSHERLQTGDFLVRVNDTFGDARMMMEKLQTDTTVTLFISRPLPFLVCFQRSRLSEDVGMELKSAPPGKCMSLVVCEITKGLVTEWNKNHPDAAVRKFDRIVQVNGVERETALMLESFKMELRLELLVVRPSQE